MTALLLAAALAFTPAPGATNPVVTQANIDSTICVRGWTKTIRPPAAYTNAVKREQLAGADPRLYEEDHMVPLELGGAPRDPRNLWSQARDDAHAKDRLEHRLHNLVCLHALSLDDAQRAIATDWQAAYRRYVTEHHGKKRHD